MESARSNPLDGNTKEEPKESTDSAPIAAEVERKCPSGHALEHRTDVFGTCDICHCSLAAGDAVLLCEDCNGYCVCKNCTELSDQPNPFVTSTELHNKGLDLFFEGNYEGAAEWFQNSLDIRESLWRQKKLQVYHSACAAEMLAKAQFLVGDVDSALENCTRAVSHHHEAYETKYVCTTEDVLGAQLTLRNMKLIQDGATPIHNNHVIKNPSHDHDLGLLGVSVYHLQTTFMAQLDVASLGKRSRIHEIENLLGHPGVIRRRGAKVVCPIDGKVGAAYCHCLTGKDHVGKAAYMLSYSWQYMIGDIVETLVNFCSSHKLNPKRTYIWIDCFCINQHRVVQAKESGGTGLLNFEEEFPVKLKEIGHMLAMMAPWKAPIYLVRIWCIFEIYIAHSKGCKVDIIMPSDEKHSLERHVIQWGGGTDSLYRALGNTKIQNAKASFDGDRQVILKMIESTVGYQELNNQVNDLLRSWMNHVLEQLVETQDHTSDERRADFCSQVGEIFYQNGEYESALKQHQRCLAIRESVLGNNHPHTARAYRNVASVLQKKGDYDGALRQLNTSVAIQESMLDKDDLGISDTHQTIGSVLSDKGDHEGALHHYDTCLEIREALLGTDHASTATIYGNVGSVLFKKGDYDGALEQHQKCLVIQQSALGKRHPSTADALNDIGVVLLHKGNYDGALEQHQKCLAIQESVLGKEHPDTAITYSNIGMVFLRMGDYDGALQQHRKCLVIQESVLGKEHPETANTHNHIGCVLQDKGDYDRALLEYEMCLATREATFGMHHQDTAAIHNDIGTLLVDKGDYDDALNEYKKCLAFQESVLGKDHPDTATTYHNIGVMLHSKGDCKHALMEFDKCLKIIGPLWGMDHPATVACLNWIETVKKDQRATESGF